MFYFILIIWIVLDLSTKLLAKLFLQDRIDLFWIFYLEYFENPGIAFSIKLPLLLLKIITIILIIAIFYYYRSELKNTDKNQKLLHISFWLILAWAIWNGVERVFNSKVIDFLWVEGFSVFNLADSFISVGAILYLFLLYKNQKF